MDFREVLYEYIIPIGVEIDWMTITGTKSNPYQHIGWVYYTDGTKANWDMDIDQSWNLPVTMNSAPPSNVGWVADMTGKICAGVLEFAIGFLGGAEVGLTRSLLGRTTRGAVKYSDDLVNAAKQAYPKLAEKTNLHHIVPKYLGGPINGPTVPLNGAYHQMITNEFRALWPYGRGITPSATELEDIIKQVYFKFPLPPGYGY